MSASVDLTSEDLERLHYWAAGYRRLCAAGLDEIVHTACTSVSEMPSGAYGDLRITDVEALLAAVEPSS